MDVSSVLFGRTLFSLLCVNLPLLFGFCPVSKQQHGVKLATKLVEAIALAVLAMLLDIVLVDPANWTTTFEPLLNFVYGFTVCLLVLRMPAGVSLFVSVWTHILAEMIIIPYMPLTSGLDTATSLGIALRLLCLVFFCVVAFLVAKLLSRMLMQQGEYTSDRAKVILSISVLLFFLLFSNYQFIFMLIEFSLPAQAMIIPVFRAVVGFGSLCMLYIENATEKRFAAQRELDLERSLRQQQQEQFRLSQENIDLINRKCHDLKHQIAALRTIQDKSEIDRQIEGMESAVMIYDSAVKTGNHVLDVVLTQKSLYCEMNDINITCMLDASCLDFVDGVDLYAMFANALDNAIEYVMTLPDKSLRVIQVSGRKENNLMLIRIRNYCDHPPRLVDGLPATTKDNKDYHGFGLRSIQKTAEQYGGGISIETGDNFYTLKILLPVPESGEV